MVLRAETEVPPQIHICFGEFTCEVTRIYPLLRSLCLSRALPLSLYLYIYVYTCIYIYIHTLYTYVLVCVYIYIYMHI